MCQLDTSYPNMFSKTSSARFFTSSVMYSLTAPKAAVKATASSAKPTTGMTSGTASTGETSYPRPPIMIVFAKIGDLSIA